MIVSSPSKLFRLSRDLLWFLTIFEAVIQSAARVAFQRLGICREALLRQRGLRALVGRALPCKSQAVGEAALADDFIDRLTHMLQSS